MSISCNCVGAIYLVVFTESIPTPIQPISCYVCGYFVYCPLIRRPPMEYFLRSSSVPPVRFFLFILFQSISVHFCPFMSVSVCFCRYLFVWDFFLNRCFYQYQHTLRNLVFPVCMIFSAVFFRCFVCCASFTNSPP